MSRAARPMGWIVLGLVSVALLVGVPLSLVRYGLPALEAGIHADPFRRADRVGAATDTVLAAVVCLCGLVWVLCAHWFASLAVAEVRGGSPALAFAGPLRPVLFKLAGTFSLLFIQQTRVPLPAAAAAATVAIPVGDDVTEPDGAHGSESDAQQQPPTQDAKWVLAGPRDSWADLAERHLGSWRRWEEVRDLTVAAREGTAQPASVSDRPLGGEVIRLPVDATDANVGPVPVLEKPVPPGAESPLLAAAFDDAGSHSEVFATEHVSRSTPEAPGAAEGVWEEVQIKPHDRVWRLVAERWPGLSNARIAEVVVAIEAKNMGSPQPSYGAFKDVDETHPGWSLLFPRYVSPLAGDPIPSTEAQVVPAGENANPGASTTLAPSPTVPRGADPVVDDGPPSVASDVNHRTATADGQCDQTMTTVRGQEGPDGEPPAVTTTTTAANGSSRTQPSDNGGNADGSETSERIRLPGVDVALRVGISVVGILAMVRLTRRRARRARHPSPGLSAEPKLRDPLPALVAAVSSSPAESEVDRTRRAPAPSQGARGAVRLVGEEADAVACGMVVARLLASTPDDLRVLVDQDTAKRVLGASQSFPGFEVLPTAAAILDEAEIERARRRRILGESMSIAEYRESDGDELLADLLVVGSPSTADAGRWAALAAVDVRLGIDVVMIGEPGTGDVRQQVYGKDVALATGDRPDWRQLEFDRLAPTAANVILDEVATARRGPDAIESEPPFEVEAPFAFDSLERTSPVGAMAPVMVRLFGAVVATTPATGVSGAIREQGRDLLVYLALHPGPQRRDAIIDELWPDVEYDKGKFKFHYAVRSLRDDVRALLERDDVGVVETASIQSDRNSGAVYELQPELFDVDVWRFQRALRAAEDASDPSERREAYAQAMANYGGEFVDGAEAHWIIREREWLRGKAVDVAAAVADLEAEAGNPEGALAALHRGIEADPYAEDLYVRGVQLLAGLGRIDAARKLSGDLERQLEELGAPMTTSREAVGRAISDAERRRSARDSLERKHEAPLVDGTGATA